MAAAGERGAEASGAAAAHDMDKEKDKEGEEGGEEGGVAEPWTTVWPHIENFRYVCAFVFVFVCLCCVCMYVYKNQGRAMESKAKV